MIKDTFTFTDAAVAVATTDQVGTDLVLKGRAHYVTFHLDNEAGGGDLDAFQVDVQAGPDSPWIAVLTTNWATDTVFKRAYTTLPTSLAAGANTIVALNALNVHAMRFKASSAVAVATINISGTITGVKN